jgi:hypothetical protein
MIDYSEGYLKLKRMVEDLWIATNARDFRRARELCSEITVEARMVRNQLVIQDDSARESTEVPANPQSAGNGSTNL